MFISWLKRTVQNAGGHLFHISRIWLFASGFSHIQSSLIKKFSSLIQQRINTKKNFRRRFSTSRYSLSRDADDRWVEGAAGREAPGSQTHLVTLQPSPRCFYTYCFSFLFHRSASLYVSLSLSLLLLVVIKNSLFEHKRNQITCWLR